MSQRQQHERTSTDQWWDDFWEHYEEDMTLEATIFFRSWCPPAGAHPQRKSIIEAISAAEEADVLDTYGVEVVGKKVCLCPACEQMYAATELAESIEQISDWRTGGMRAAGFQTRSIDSDITDESYKALKPPETAIAIYAEGTIRGVFPCRADGECYNVDHFLTDLVSTVPDVDPPERFRSEVDVTSE